MATGTAANNVGGSYLDRAFSAGGDLLTAYIADWRMTRDVSAQERIIRAQGEQDRITNATALAYSESAKSVEVKQAPKSANTMPPWVMWVAASAAAVVGVYLVVKK